MFFSTQIFCLECETYIDENKMEYAYDNIGICKKCVNNLATTKDFTFDGKEYIDMAISPFLYEGIIRQIVKEFKFGGQKLYGKLLATMLSEQLKDNHLLDAFDLIVPVPLHKKRLSERGYNQSDILAKQIGKSLKIPVEVKALKRIRETQRQSGLKGIQRIENVKDAFVCEKKCVRNKNIILVDDIYTMGETANACGKALKDCGANKVIALTVCKTVSKKAILY